VPLHQVRRRPRIGLPLCGADPATPAHAAQARVAHQARNPLAPDADTLFGELGMNARHPVGAA